MSTGARSRHRFEFWRSPADQPSWARPVLLVMSAVGAAVYSWGAGNYLEIYYAAAVRSMSMSWHDFIFGAFDPAGTISLDKLPGALWVQALAVRLLGLHAWVLVLPQAIEGALTVLVLYRAVRRLVGALGGIFSAGVLVISPATAALNRGNIPDTLMILCLVLAADATVSAVSRGKTAYFLVAGAWVGLAFQAKMVEAWLILPALILVYLVAAPVGRVRRVLASIAMCLVAAAISLSWMAFVSLTPANQRPYVDGSQNNSVFQQVFIYNGFGRLDELSPDQLVTKSIGLQLGASAQAQVHWDRLLTGSLGRDTGWLLPSSAVVLIGGLVAVRRRSRTDLLRAGLLLWGTWLLVLLLTFTVSSTVNSYYTAALSPPVAGLLGTGVALAWQSRRTVAFVLTALAVSASFIYAAWLLPAEATGLPPWLEPLVIGLGLLAIAALCLAAIRPLPRAVVVGALSLSALAICLVPAVATTSVVSDRLGPFDTPFQPPPVSAYIWDFFAATPAAVAKTLPTLEGVRQGAPYLMATQSSVLASPFIYYSGLETLPIGGFTGTIPSPSLASIKEMIARGDFHLELQSPTTTDPRLVWIAKHCIHAGEKKGAGPIASAPVFAVYFCLPSAVDAPARPHR